MTSNALQSVSIQLAPLVKVHMPCYYMHAQGPIMTCEGLAPSTATACCCGQTPFTTAELRKQTVSSCRQQRCRCATGVRARTLQRAVRGHKSAYIVSAQAGDPFAAAGSRLQSLLSGVGYVSSPTHCDWRSPLILKLRILVRSCTVAKKLDNKTV